MKLLPNSQEVGDMFDIRSWLEPYISDIKHHTKPLSFKFSKDTSNPNKVNMYYKKTVHQNWQTLEHGMFRICPRTNLIKRPTGKPKFLQPNYDDLDIPIKLKKLKEVWSKYFDDQLNEGESKLWRNRLETYMNTKDNPKKVQNLWLLEQLKPFEISEKVPEAGNRQENVPGGDEDTELDRLLREEEENPKVQFALKSE